jgi:hypothetical protein
MLIQMKKSEATLARLRSGQLQATRISELIEPEKLSGYDQSPLASLAGHNFVEEQRFRRLPNCAPVIGLITPSSLHLTNTSAIIAN